MMGIFCQKPEETESKQTVQWQEGKKEMTREEIMRIALEQSAIDANCRPEDFISGQNRTVISKANEKARKYLELPSYCMLISYGDNIVASVDPAVSDEVENIWAGFRLVIVSGRLTCIFSTICLPEMIGRSVLWQNIFCRTASVCGPCPVITKSGFFFLKI